MNGFRSLGDEEEVEFECKPSTRGLEATRVTGPQNLDCRGSHRRPLNKKNFRKIRCFNCGEFGHHIAAKCVLGPQPKRCHNCKSEDHLIAECPIKSTLQLQKLLKPQLEQLDKEATEATGTSATAEPPTTTIP